MRKLNCLASIRYVAVVFAITAVLLVSGALADDHTGGVPVLNSLPGAPYTLYLDFAGFNFTGGWGGGKRQAPRRPSRMPAPPEPSVRLSRTISRRSGLASRRAIPRFT